MRKFTRSSGYAVKHDLQDQLIKAALFKDERAIEIWKAWQPQVDEDDLDEGSHRLLPLLFKNLSALGVGAEELKEYKRVYRFYWYKNQLLASKIVPILKAFAEEGIQYLLLKGLPLAYGYYPDPGLRPFGDIDILVKPGKAGWAFAALRSLGFSPWVDYPGELVTEIRHSALFLSKEGYRVDLHWDLLPRNWGVRANENLWNDVHQFQVGDATLETPHPSAHLLQACLHGIEWSFVAPVRWVADASFILDKRLEQINWDWIIQESRKRRLSEQLKHQFERLKVEFEIPIPERAIAALESGRHPRWQKVEKIVVARPPNLFTKLIVFWFYHLRSNPEKSLLARIHSFPGYLKAVFNLGPDEKLVFVLVQKLRHWI